MCESYNLQYKRNYISLMPTNTFGPGDNYNLNNSHFIPAILRKIYQAKKK
jgi:GDP-L-fucose synthase